MDTCTPLVCFSCKQEPTTRKGFWHHHFLFDWKKETRRERVPSAPLAFKEKQETYQNPKGQSEATKFILFDK